MDNEILRLFKYICSNSNSIDDRFEVYIRKCCIIFITVSYGSLNEFQKQFTN